MFRILLEVSVPPDPAGRTLWSRPPESLRSIVSRLPFGVPPKEVPWAASRKLVSQASEMAKLQSIMGGSHERLLPLSYLTVLLPPRSADFEPLLGMSRTLVGNFANMRGAVFEHWLEHHANTCLEAIQHAMQVPQHMSKVSNTCWEVREHMLCISRTHV